MREAVERCQINEKYGSEHPTAWAQFRISDIKTIISAASAQQGLVEALRDATRRSKYPWSEGGSYNYQDYKNEGAIEICTQILTAYEKAMEGK